MVGFESSLEHDLMFRLDVDPDVIWFESQPTQIQFSDSSGAKRHYTPDVLVHYASRKGAPEQYVLYEVKYLEDLYKNWPDLKPRMAAAGAFAQAKGWRFEIQSEHEIKTDYLWNARLLWPYCRRTKVPLDRAAVLKVVRDLGEATISEVLANFDECAPEVRSGCIVALWQLIAERLIHANLEVKLNDQSRVWK